MSVLQEVNAAVNGFVWGVPAMVVIVGAGVWLSIRTRFIQFTRVPVVLRSTVGKLFSRKCAASGAISPFQAVCTALAGTVGTGNIAGVAGAVALGGPGAVFWMWCSALLGMCTKFAEVTLAVRFRETNACGERVGGPMYYIKNGLSRRWLPLAYLYALFGVMAVFGTGNATQANTICSSVVSVATGCFGAGDGCITVIRFSLGAVLALLVAGVLLGGIKRIGSFAVRVVPFMALLFIILAIGVIVMNIGRVPEVLASIVHGAFSPRGVTGGAVGSVFVSMQRGVSRGIFSNEAGLGTGSIAHACADTDSPVEQGYFGIFEVFVDTIVICTMTALVILLSGTGVAYGQPAGAELTISGFTSVYGEWISIVTALAICSFAFTTTIGWGLYGSRCVEFVFGHRAVRPFLVAYSLVAVLGATLDVGFVWDVADTFNGLMVVPNLLGLFLLSGTLVRILRGDASREWRAAKNV